MDALTTCWTVIRSAANGSQEDRSAFVVQYKPVVRSYLEARWRGPPMRQEVEEAIQETMLECFRKGGVIEQVALRQPQGFQRFLKGVVRNVALRLEDQRKRRTPSLSDSHLDDLDAQEERLSQVFDRAWARTMLAEAVALLKKRADEMGQEAQRRAELLHQRFSEDRPIREIAGLWGEDAAKLHRQYRRAREEFRAVLLDVLHFHHPGTPRSAEKELQELLLLLGRREA